MSEGGAKYRDRLVINNQGQLLLGIYIGWEGYSRLGRSVKRHFRWMEGAVVTVLAGQTWCLSRAEAACGRQLRFLSPKPSAPRPLGETGQLILPPGLASDLLQH